MNIYPIELTDSRARMIIASDREARSELAVAMKHDTENAEYEYSGKLMENGDVEVSVWCSDDDGFAQTAGTIFSKTMRPFNSEQIEMMVDDQKTRLAAEEYSRREEERVRNEIRKIRAEMFGDE